jgi:type II secretory pathway pseudopilin PulG
MLSRSRTTSRRSAFTLIEFIVAMTLTIGVLAAGSLAMASSERALTGVRELDQATRIGYEVLEKVRTFGCGVAVNATTAAAANQACATQSPTNANGAFKDWVLKTGSPSMAGDFVIERKVDLRPAEEQAANPNAPDASKQVFTVTVRSVWVQPGQLATDCRATTTSAFLSQAEVLQPSLIRRTVTIESDGPQGLQAVSLSAVETVPTGVAYTPVGSGSAIVDVTPSAGATQVPVTLRADDGSWSVTRFWAPGECRQLWFPYLPPAVYTAVAGTVGGNNPTTVVANSAPATFTVNG